MSGQFTADINKWVEETQLKGDQVLRAVALELLSRVVTRSPVGNPELWAANAHAIYQRKTYNLFAERLNSVATAENFQRAQDPANFNSKGQLKKPSKMTRLLTARTLAKKFKLTSGQGYVGGRFRGNWQVTFGSPATDQLTNVDPSGSATIADGSNVLADAQVGTMIYLINNLPYSERLEDGWSKQAPAGMVKVTVADFTGIVDAIGGARAVGSEA